MLALTAVAFSACGGVQSALNPSGPQSASISRLWWFIFAVCLAVFVAVIAFLSYATVGRRHVRHRERDAFADPAVEAALQRKMRRGVLVAISITIVTMFVLLIASLVTGSKLDRLAAGESRKIQIIGHQWWWEVRYNDPDPSRTVTTANQIHLPVGEPVLLQLTTADVIHSFWAPNLTGKKDLIPGRVNTTWIRADRPGLFRGQCAEFCGLQHAHMSFTVIVEPRSEFAAWLDRQRLPAAAPLDPVAQRGRDIFLSSPCVLCHTIRGTGAFGTVAPDLTHLASRSTIAAGMLPNTIGNLGGWILDPQNIKPGTVMPATHVDSQDLQPLLEYLHGLN